MKRHATRRVRARKPTATATGTQRSLSKETTDNEDDKKSEGKSAMLAPKEGAVTNRKVASRSVATTSAEQEHEDETQRHTVKSHGGGNAGRSTRMPANRKTKTTTKPTTKMAPEVEHSVNKFVQHVQEAGVEGLRKEFDEIKNYLPPDYTFEAFTKNKERNRFADVVCLDATRVVLKNDYGNYTSVETDYINANWVDLEGVDRKYIAAMGPLPSTIEDFWRMVFQEQVSSIAMICKVVENDQPKCAQYWPLKQGEYQNYGKMFVNNKKVESEEKFDTYTLEVLPDGCSNSVVIKLIHCTSWPDQGVPNSGRMVLRMLKMIKESAPGPVVVHCSAGIGRTGTILAIEAINTRLFKGKETTVKEVFQQLRNCRASSIQTEAQYLFVYSTVLDYIKAKLPAKYSDVVKKFYHELEKL